MALRALATARRRAATPAHGTGVPTCRYHAAVGVGSGFTGRLAPIDPAGESSTTCEDRAAAVSRPCLVLERE
jgi:hypothetical protein